MFKCFLINVCLVIMVFGNIFYGLVEGVVFVIMGDVIVWFGVKVDLLEEY